MRYLLTTAVAALGLVPAVVLAAPDQPAGQNPPAMQMQPGGSSVPDAEIGKAGAALHDVAKVQEKYQGKMEAASPEQRQGLSKQATAEAVQAIQARGLSVQEYVHVVQAAQSDPQVKQRLLEVAQKTQ